MTANVAYRRVIWAPEEEKSYIKAIWSNNVQSFPNLMKTINPQIQEAQQTSGTKKWRNYSKAHYNYLKPSENLKGSQREKRHYVQLNKGKNNGSLLIS